MSLEIFQFSTYPYESNEALGFHSHVLGETSVLPEATTGKVLADYRAAVEELKVQLKNNQGGISMDEMVKAADKRRDDAYVNGFDYLKVMSKSVEADIAAAATTIKEVFERFPDVRKANNNTETGVLENLIEDLSAIDKATVKLAGFTNWLKELDSAQKAFSDAIHNKISFASSQANMDLKSAKQNCENAYKALVKRVNAIAELEGDNKDFDPTFINNVNAFIESIKEQAAKSTKSVKKGESGDAESTDSEASADTSATAAAEGESSAAADTAAAAVSEPATAAANTAAANAAAESNS